MDIPLLGIHSHFSFLNGVPKIQEIVKDAKEKGYSHITLTDNSNLHGVVEFYKMCKKNDMRPIVGVSVYLDPHASCHPRLILIAKNNTGYKNLLRVMSDTGIAQSSSHRIIITKDILRKNREGLVAIIPPINSEFILRTNTDTLVDEYRAIFGQNLYLGITNQLLKEWDDTKDGLLALANKHAIPTVISQVIYYLNSEDRDARNTILKIQRTKRSGLELEMFPNNDLSLPFAKDTVRAFEKFPGTIENTKKLAAECIVDIEFGVWKFPDIEVEHTPEKTLREYVFTGLENRNMTVADDKIKQRVEKELDVIISKGYAKYFLVVKEMVKYMNEQRIPTSTRGSAAGCLVSYALGITDIDPITYDIPFERFLNPFRPSPPDIDIDIADDRRNDVIQFISDRFGSENVAQIVTFGTMLARAAVRDTARALGYPYTSGDRIAKLIPIGKQGMPMTIEKAFDEVPEFKELYKKNKDVKKIIDTAKKIEGNVRHISVHAAGVVIDTDGIRNRVPIQVNPKDCSKIITQFNMHAIEDIGLLKFDILGITNLAVLADTVKRIQNRNGNFIDLKKLPLDDQKTYHLLKQGLTRGIFQLGGSGMTQMVVELEPRNIYDISALIALYRPGPMANIPIYIRRKKGEERVSYPHPKMEKYLKTSYGVMVYQEDVLYTAIELAGYSWGEVDVFRKAIGKKIPELMAVTEVEFKERCKKHSGMSQQEVNTIWNLFIPFQGYGFNKAHAMSYAHVVHQTAYLKAHYPAEFMASVLSAAGGNLEEIHEFIQESKKLCLLVLSPNINKSRTTFFAEYGKNNEKGIRVGLASIKNLGENIAKQIVKEREKGGEYKSLGDFITRVSVENSFNKKSLEGLIKVGALDIFASRNVMLDSMDMILQYGKENRKESTQTSLFSKDALIDIHLPEQYNTYPKTQILAWEKEMSGLYFSGHPLKQVKVKGYSIQSIRKMRNGADVQITGIITALKPHRKKDGSKMCFFRLEDQSDSVDAVCFTEALTEYEDLIAENRTVYIGGKIKERNGEPSLVIERVKDPELVLNK